MTFTLPALPYSKEALVPHMSVETFDYHYEKHHKTYVDNLNKLVGGTEFEGRSLEEIIKTSNGGIFNNAAQIWNHTFFWHCLTPANQSKISPALTHKLTADFGSVEAFKEKFTDAAVKQFGSGWAWVVLKPNGKLEITSTSNAQTPLTGEDRPVLTCDVWEHAYYIDHRNKRADFLAAFWNIINWSFMESNIKG